MRTPCSRAHAIARKIFDERPDEEIGDQDVAWACMGLKLVSKDLLKRKVVRNGCQELNVATQTYHSRERSVPVFTPFRWSH